MRSFGLCGLTDKILRFAQDDMVLGQEVVSVSQYFLVLSGSEQVAQFDANVEDQDHDGDNAQPVGDCDQKIFQSFCICK